MKFQLQSNLVITNSTGSHKSVCYNREGLCSKGTIWDQKGGAIFVCYSCEFVIAVIVITEFDCILQSLTFFSFFALSTL
jgi:hypothetical protein